jgi:hypothetical protein
MLRDTRIWDYIKLMTAIHLQKSSLILYFEGSFSSCLWMAVISFKFETPLRVILKLILLQWMTVGSQAYLKIDNMAILK